LRFAHQNPAITNKSPPGVDTNAVRAHPKGRRSNFAVTSSTMDNPTTLRAKIPARRKRSAAST
jgi:hypothetical protein